MNDKLIFSIDHVRDFKRVSKNIDDFDNYAQLVQMNYVSELIGETLYCELLEDILEGEPQNERFVKLLDGETYEDGDKKVIFRGLRLYCSYLWTWLYLLDSQTKVTPIGPNLFKDNESDGAQGRQGTENLISSCINLADSMEEKIVNYISKDDTYPEYKNSESSEPADKSNFSFTTIGGSYGFSKNIID